MNHRIPIWSKLRMGIVALFCLVVLLGLSFPVLAGPSVQDAPPTPVPTQVVEPLPGIPVKLGPQTLFYVYERLGPLTPAERAALASSKLNQLAEDPFAPRLELTLAESELGTDVMAGDAVLLTVTDADAATAGMDRTQAAQTAAQSIQEAVQRRRQLNTPLAWAMRILITLGLLACVVAILYLLNRAFQPRLRWLEQTPVAAVAADGGATTGFYRTAFGRRFVRALINFGRAVLILLMLFVVTPLILRLFPITAEIGRQLTTYLTNVLSSIWNWFGDNSGNLFTILVIILVTYCLVHVVEGFFKEVGQGRLRLRGFDPEWASFTSRIISFLLVAGAVIVAFPYIPGSDSEAFRGITIFLGALFTLASTSAVSNIVAGVILTYTGAFSAGDIVKIGETTGVVTEKRLLTTRIRTSKQEEVSIPNSVVMNASVVNYSTQARTQGVILYTTVTIGYDVPWRTVHELLLSAAAATPNLLTDPPPFVLQLSLNDFSIPYQLNCYTNRTDMMPRLYSDLHRSILDQFNAAGVEIMSPAYTALRDGNTTTIPAENRPAEYRVPGFRLDPRK